MGGFVESDPDWFSVKLLHRITISETPDNDKIDAFYHDIREFFEESIVRVKASSFDEAYQLAEKEAASRNEVYANKYGQTVNCEFCDALDCYHMFYPPRSLTEVYSTFFFKDQAEDVGALLGKRYGSSTVAEMHVLRRA